MAIPNFEYAKQLNKRLPFVASGNNEDALHVEVHIINCGYFVSLKVGVAKHGFYALKILKIEVRTQLAANLFLLAQLPAQSGKHVRSTFKFEFELRPA